MKTSSEYRTLARAAMNGKMGDIVIAMLVYLLVGIVIALPILCLSPMFDNKDGMVLPWGMFMFLIFIFVIAVIFIFAPMAYGLYVVFLQALRRPSDEADALPFFRLMFANTKKHWSAFMIYYFAFYFLNMLASLLTVFVGGIGSLIVTLVYAFVPFVIHDNPDMRVSDAMATGRRMVTDHFWDFFKLCFSFIGWFLLCIITLGIALFYVFPYMCIAIAAFYEDIKAEDDMLKAGEYTPA